MQQNLETSPTPSLVEDRLLSFHEQASLDDALLMEVASRPGSRGRDERVVNIPVIFPIFHPKLRHNTVQINVSLGNPPLCDELVEKIVFASEGILRSITAGDDDQYYTARRDMQKCLSTPGFIHLSWDFTPPKSLVDTGCIMPLYDTLDAWCVSFEELRSFYELAHAGRKSYIFATVILSKTEYTVGLKETGEGADNAPPASLSEYERRSTSPLPRLEVAPLRQPRLVCQNTVLQNETVSTSTTALEVLPLPEHASQTVSTLEEAVKLNWEESDNIIHTEPQGTTRYLDPPSSPMIDLKSMDHQECQGQYIEQEINGSNDALHSRKQADSDIGPDAPNDLPSDFDLALTRQDKVLFIFMTACICWTLLPVPELVIVMITVVTMVVAIVFLMSVFN
ncbi:hypothetical protein GGS21DRAFT_549099 [Xylaria nigripes]|nr:hypothetical protein GGS21DRAFT_549099 [Xylaria nigripes]